MDLSFITREGFIAWLKTKPAEGQYDYCDNRNCPWAQFLKANGIEDPFVYPETWYQESNRKEVGGIIPPWFYMIGLEVRHSTFGSLLQRIEAAPL